MIDDCGIDHNRHLVYTAAMLRVLCTQTVEGGTFRTLITERLGITDEANIALLQDACDIKLDELHLVLPIDDHTLAEMISVATRQPPHGRKREIFLLEARRFKVLARKP